MVDWVKRSFPLAWWPKFSLPGPQWGRRDLTPEHCHLTSTSPPWHAYTTNTLYTSTHTHKHTHAQRERKRERELKGSKNGSPKHFLACWFLSIINIYCNLFLLERVFLGGASEYCFEFLTAHSRNKGMMGNIWEISQLLFIVLSLVDKVLIKVTVLTKAVFSKNGKWAWKKEKKPFFPPWSLQMDKCQSFCYGWAMHFYLPWMCMCL